MFKVNDLLGAALIQAEVGVVGASKKIELNLVIFVIILAE